MASFEELNFLIDKCFNASLLMFVLMRKFPAVSSLLSSANEKHIDSFAFVGKEMET